MALKRKKVQKKKAVKAKPKKSLTKQTKMKLELKGTCGNGGIITDQAQKYDENINLERQKNSPGRHMSKRIAGYMKARTRKGQVERDRVTGSKTR
jgi:hypothetical protein